MLSRIKHKVPIKLFMIGYLVSLLLYASFRLGVYERLFYGLLIAIAYVVFDVLWTKFRDDMWYVPSSSIISGLILATVGSTAENFLVPFAVALVAVFSKQVLHKGTLRHIFNPAAFSLTFFGVLSFLVPSWNIAAPTWWAVAWMGPAYIWGTQALSLVLLIGVFILWRQNRFHVAISFLLIYVLGLCALFLADGKFVEELPSLLHAQLFDGTLLFFMTVMLIEPITSSFPSFNTRIIYGVLVGLGTVGLTAFSSATSWTLLGAFDPLLGGLLFGDAVASVAFLPRRRVS